MTRVGQAFFREVRDGDQGEIYRWVTIRGRSGRELEVGMIAQKVGLECGWDG